MCGICAAISPTPLTLESIVKQLTLVNHRGHEAVGLATISSDGMLNRFVGLGPAREACHVDQQPFRAFSEKFAAKHSRVFVGHTRYSTIGSSTLNNAQPLQMENPNFGPFLLVHNGQIPNHHRFREQLVTDGQRFVTDTDSEVLAALLAHSSARTLTDAVQDLLEKVPGAYSIIVAGRQHVVAARDRHGMWPLWFGTLTDETIVIASEAPGLGQVIEPTTIAPGNMLTVDVKAHTYFVQKVCVPRPKRCWLDVAYLSRPDEGVGKYTTGDVRIALGQQLARERPVTADLVVGVPDSGVDAAAGFAAISNITLESRALVRNRFAPGRTFILPGQTQRTAAILNKHAASSRKVFGKNVVVVDDTIIRANTASAITTLLKAAGAISVHWRIAAPVVTRPCFYGIDIPTTEELAAHLGSEAAIAASVGANSLQYLSQAGTLAVLNQFESGWCMACVNGHYPITLT